MTKKEQKLVNKFLKGIALNKRYKRLVDARIFNKKSKPGSEIVVVPLKHILKEWKKFRIQVEGK